MRLFVLSWMSRLQASEHHICDCLHAYSETDPGRNLRPVTDPQLMLWQAAARLA